MKVKGQRSVFSVLSLSEVGGGGYIYYQHSRRSRGAYQAQPIWSLIKKIC